MTISDTLIILATLLSPLIAVQVQKWIEHSSETRNQQRQVFYDLMATRATRVAPKHVEPVEGDNLFTDLLEALAAVFSYPFDRVQLKRGIYYPRAHSQAEMRREIFEREVLRLLMGGSALNMRVTEFPFSADDNALTRKLYEGILRALSEDALKTKAV